MKGEYSVPIAMMRMAVQPINSCVKKPLRKLAFSVILKRGDLFLMNMLMSWRIV
jgi:hypothetical protein